MTYLFTELHPAVRVALFGVIGCVVGRLIVLYTARVFPRDSNGDLFHPPRRIVRIQNVPILGSLLWGDDSGRLTRRQSLGIETGTAILFAAFVVAAVGFGCQKIQQVTPSDTWRYGRVVYHLCLISLLIAATVTDFVDYVIPDEITAVGVIVGLAGAVISGDLQMVHLWIDWNPAGLMIDGGIQFGAYIPEWIDQHRHWHGLAWSALGAAAGAGVIWLLRLV